MTKSAFLDLLGRVDEYQTVPGSERSLPDRLLGWSSAWYYVRLIALVARANLLVRMGRFTRERWTERALEVVHVIEGCRGRIRLIGLNHIRDAQSPIVVIANHMSMIETMVLPGALVLPFHDVTTVVKDDLLRYPLFGAVMRALDPIAVTRRNPRDDLKQVLEKGTRELRAGRSVLVFPQATRAAGFSRSAFNSLGVKLARRAGVPILPVALKTDFQQNGRFIKDLGRVDRTKTLYFKFGPVMPVNGTGREAHEAVVTFIAESLRDWGVQVEEPAGSGGEENK